LTETQRDQFSPEQASKTTMTVAIANTTAVKRIMAPIVRPCHLCYCNGGDEHAEIYIILELEVTIF
jgi:hypothetical protein